DRLPDVSQPPDGGLRTNRDDVHAREPASNVRGPGGSLRGGLVNWLTEPLQYPFMQRALMEVVIIGVLCGLVGCFVVLRGLAFIGDALAHAVFPGVVLSYVADRSILVGAFIFGSLTALGIGILSRSRRVSEDSAIGVVFAAFFALGVVILSR